MDYLASNICLPVGGLFLLDFVGWFWGRETRPAGNQAGAATVPNWILTSCVS
jgi:SNF family Na+-dependent transporter